MFRLLVGLIWAIALVGCQTSGGRQPEASSSIASSDGDRTRSVSAVFPSTIIPSKFDARSSASANQGLRTVPRSMLAVAEVTRPRAELREGPGSAFMLNDAMLLQGTEVLVFAKVGVWLKVLVPGQWQKGWVHRQAVSDVRPNDRAMQIDIASLPTVLTLRDIDLVRSYPTQRELRVEIPKGLMFHTFMENDWGTLVWLPETNSAMWMARKDVQ